MTLPTHPLGNSGLHITRVGFGSWAVGSGGWLFCRRNFTNHFSADDAARCGIAKRTACCATWGQAKRHGPRGNRLPRGAS